jgi:hypothetical protein
MIHYPQPPPPEQPAITMVVQPDDLRQKIARDIRWNQPVFKAPALPIPNVPLEPLPLRANRVTKRPAAGS